VIARLVRTYPSQENPDVGPAWAAGLSLLSPRNCAGQHTYGDRGTAGTHRRPRTCASYPSALGGGTPGRRVLLATASAIAVTSCSEFSESQRANVASTAAPIVPGTLTSCR
jgi:hypothetical protein